MFRKIVRMTLPDWLIDRASQLLKRLARQPVRQWAYKNSIKLENLTSGADEALWAESITMVSEFSFEANKLLSRSKVKQGGAGALEFLYYAVRKLKPEVVFETGVASGWSSAIILHGLNANNHGLLLSSDLPYKDRPGSKELIGVLVPPNLTPRWRLCCEGDRSCIDTLLEHTKQVDIFHYDSDKSVSGRRFAWDKLRPKLSENSLVIFDDIQDNWEFKRLLKEINAPFFIFEYQGKFVGCIVFGQAWDQLFG